MDGKVISPANYTVEYKNNYTDYGEAEIHVIGKNQYAGYEGYKKFNINDGKEPGYTPQSANLKTLRFTGNGKMYVAWSETPHINGYQIRIAKDRELKTDAKDYTVTGSTSGEFDGYTDGTYYVGVRTFCENILGGKYYYSKWSNIETVPFEAGSQAEPQQPEQGEIESPSVQMTAVAIKGAYNSRNGAEIRWNRTDGADGYVVYRQRSSEGTKKIAVINNPGTLKWNDSSVKYGRVYSYFVKALYGGKEGPSSNKVAFQRLSKVKITSRKNKRGKSVVLKWKNVNSGSNPSGYEIQYARSAKDLSSKTGSFKSVKVKGRNKLNKTIKKLSKGKTYYFRIRSYVDCKSSKTGKKTRVWSQYSPRVKVKVKK